MLNYFRAESRRYLRSRYTWISLAIVLLLSLLLTYAYASDANTIYSARGIRTVIGSGIPNWTTLSMMFAAYAQMGVIFLVITNILVVLYYREWQGRAIANTIAAGVSRAKLYFTKYLHAAVFTAGILLFFFVIHTAFLTFLLNTDKMIDIYPDIWNLFLHILIYYLAFLAILHGLVFMSGGGFLPIILGVTLSTYIFETLFINLIRFIRNLGPWTGDEIASFLQKVSLQAAFQTLVIKQTGAMGGLAAALIPNLDFNHAVQVLLGYTLLFLALGYLSFRRRPIAD